MIAAQKTEGPAENTHVIARSEATWQSRGSRNIPENRRDCHALRARNDAVVGGWSSYFTLLASGERHGGRSLRSALAPELPGCRSGGFTRLPSSNIHQSRVCQRPLAAAKTKGPPGGRVVLLSDSDEGGRNRLEEAFAVRHCQPDASHYSKEPQLRQSLESKINT